MLKDRLKSERTSKKLSQQKLANIIGVSQQTIGSWETGRTEPDQESLKKLASFFEVSLDYLLGNSNDHPKPLSTLTQKDNRDIAARLEQIKTDLESQQGLMLYNNDLDNETKEFLIASLERTMKQSKILAKDKFTPKKYKH